VIAAPGNVGVGIDATLSGPRGNAISGTATDNRTTLSDVFYQSTLKWNQGVNNEMVYITGNIPSGTYDPNRLENLSLGYVAWDAGAGYTYLDTKTGHEFSVVGGFTYSLMNPDLQYQNGIDFHVDWAASQFVSKNVHIGLAGYLYQQVTDDSGPSANVVRARCHDERASHAGLPLRIPGLPGACHRAALCADPLGRPGMTMRKELALSMAVVARRQRQSAGSPRAASPCCLVPRA